MPHPQIIGIKIFVNVWDNFSVELKSCQQYYVSANISSSSSFPLFRLLSEFTPWSRPPAPLQALHASCCIQHIQSSNEPLFRLIGYNQLFSHLLINIILLAHSLIDVQRIYVHVELFPMIYMVLKNRFELDEKEFWNQEVTPWKINLFDSRAELILMPEQEMRVGEFIFTNIITIWNEMCFSFAPFVSSWE